MITDSSVEEKKADDNTIICFAVVVATYNSEKTIVSTLESIKNQTVLPTEVVISDDCSKDNTVDICKRWISDNHHLFQKITLVETDSNTGVAGNFNRGFDAVTPCCEWIKLIAGDDLLIPDCLQSYQKYIDTHPEAQAIYATIIGFKGEYELSNTAKKTFKHANTHLKLSNCDAQIQCRFFDYFGQFTMSPTAMIKRELHQRIRFDERVPMIEDVPFNYNCLHHGVKLHYLPCATVYYRINDSISHQSQKFFNPVFIESIEKYDSFYTPTDCKSLLYKCVRLKDRLSKKRLFLFYYTLDNRPNLISSLLFWWSGKMLEKFNGLLIWFFLKRVEHTNNQ